MFDRQNSFHYPSYNYIESLKNNLPNNAVFFIAIKDSIVQGSLILLYDENTGYAMYAGSIMSPITGSLDLLHFEAMKFLQKKKVSRYDFVGTRIDIKPDSKQEGIDRFKRKFKPTLKQGYAFKVIINPIKHKIFDILVKIYFIVKGYNYIESINQIKKDTLVINNEK
jgi:lipid II:glycine glycyltransferase (peptidoglycan interpeptide bridge formation enzyme)